MNETARNRWAKDVANYDVPHHRLKQVGLVIKEISPSHYVDMGCAKGTLRTLTPGIKYTGCDFIQQDNADFEFYKCDFNSQPFPAELQNIELFSCSGLLEYIEDVPAFLKQLNERLRPSGKLVLTYFNMNHISRIIKMLKGGSFPVHPDWRGFYSCKDLQAQLSVAGFRITRIIPTNHSMTVSKAVGNTLEEKIQLHDYKFYSYLLAHQFIFVCENKNAK